MSEDLDDLIKEIAVKHGISVGKDDPILILQTVNERLIESTKKAHQDILLNFKEELESISARWREDAKEKSEKILNAALISSKEMMAKLVQQSTTQATDAIQGMLNNAVIELKSIEMRTKKYSMTALIASGILISLGFFAAFYLL